MKRIVIHRNGRVVIMRMEDKLARQMMDICRSRGETVYES